MTEHILLYDCERDGDIKPGKILWVFEDGKTKRVRESTLYGKEFDNVRQPQFQQSGLIRGRATREVKHRTKHAKQTSPGKRDALSKT